MTTAEAKIELRIIPHWITLLNVVVIVILLFKTYSAFVNPALAYGLTQTAGNQPLLWELAGRNIAMLLVTIIAMSMANPSMLFLIFLMNVFREAFDMGMVMWFEGIAGLPHAASFLLFIIPYLLALKKLRTLSA